MRGVLDELPPLQRQQYLDFLTNCTWRCALVCHRDVRVRSSPDERVLHDSWVSLRTARRGELVAPDARIQEAVSCLEERRPESVAFGDLAESGARSTAFFMDAYATGLIDLTLSPAGVSCRIGDYPRAGPLARLQAEDGPTVTNHNCETVRLTDLARHVATLLDGVHSRDDVAKSVAREIESGALANDWVLRLPDDELNAERVTAKILRHLRDHGLLVG